MSAKKKVGSAVKDTDPTGRKFASPIIADWSDLSPLEAAQRYHRIGWSVIPANGKEPAVMWEGYQAKRASKATIDDWFRDVDCNIALVCGSVSGRGHCLVVRDFDDQGAYAEWAAKNPSLANVLPTAKTKRGFHVYARIPKAVRTSVIAGGEIRAEGAVVILPPSTHPSNFQTYLWVRPPTKDVPVLTDPAALLGPSSRNTDYTERTETPKSLPSSLSSSVLSVQWTEEVERAVASTQPTEYGNRHRHVFCLAREVKAIPSLASRPALELQPIVAEWHRRALPNIFTKDFETTWGEFIDGWKRVHTPAGSDALAHALSKAREAPEPLCSLKYPAKEVRLLLALCRELQRADGDHFYLSCRAAGKAIGVYFKTANNWMRLFLEYGDLVPLDRPSRETRRAFRYRYTGDM